MTQVAEMNKQASVKGHGPAQLSTFRLGDEWFGIDVLSVQEVMNPLPITRVPIAPLYICGLINVRGIIVSVISLKQRLGFADVDYTEEHNLVIVNADDGLVCLQVDEIGDVLETGSLSFAEVPATVFSSSKEYVMGVFKLDGRLVSHLDVMRLIDN